MTSPKNDQDLTEEPLTPLTPLTPPPRLAAQPSKISLKQILREGPTGQAQEPRGPSRQQAQMSNRHSECPYLTRENATADTSNRQERDQRHHCCSCELM